MGVNNLSDAEVERLALVAEEMGEAIQAVGKVLRHGYESRSPLIPKGPTNRERLEEELAHVYVAARMMLDAGDLRRLAVASHEGIKAEQVKQYLHHQ